MVITGDRTQMIYRAASVQPSRCRTAAVAYPEERFQLLHIQDVVRHPLVAALLTYEADEPAT
jgi:hypothetical protein